MESLDSLSDFHLFHFPFQSFQDRSKYPVYNWYKCHSHIQQLSYFLQGPSTCLPLRFLLFPLSSPLEQQSQLYSTFFFLFSFCELPLGLIFWPVICLYLEIPDNFGHLILLDRFFLEHILLVCSKFNFLHSSEWDTFLILQCLILLPL